MKFSDIAELFEVIGTGDIVKVHSKACSLAEIETETNAVTGGVLVKSLGVLDTKESSVGVILTDDFNPLSLMTITEPSHAPHYMILSEHIEKYFLDIEREYKARDKLKSRKLLHSRKVLLYGPPGCGKTLGANRLCHRLGLPLCKVKLDTVVSKNDLGVSLRNLRILFDYAVNNKCILLIDECDFIARTRSNSANSADMDRIVNVLLVLLDEYRGDSIIIATTNLQSALDPALFRRFDLVINVPLPTKTEQLRLLQDTIAKYDFVVAREIDLKDFLKPLMGRNSSYIVRVAEIAVKLAVMSNATTINKGFLETAISEVSKL